MLQEGADLLDEIEANTTEDRGKETGEAVDDEQTKIEGEVNVLDGEVEGREEKRRIWEERDLLENERLDVVEASEELEHVEGLEETDASEEGKEELGAGGGLGGSERRKESRGRKGRVRRMRREEETSGNFLALTTSSNLVELKLPPASITMALPPLAAHSARKERQHWVLPEAGGPASSRTEPERRPPWRRRSRLDEGG